LDEEGLRSLACSGAQAANGGGELKGVFAGSMPFVGVMGVALLLVALVPWLATALVR
jgi:TRAP-type C4-dicarboxylate transport system permease large subunit